MNLETAKNFYETLYVCDAVLTKFKIDYSLTGGTLLGALRHGGMIPWDEDLDVMVFNPEQQKMFEPEIVEEFNKYGFNFYIECNDIFDPNCEGKYVNHIYNELRYGSKDCLTTEVFSIQKFQTTKYNGGKCLSGGSVELLDFFPHTMCDSELQLWRPAWTPYNKDDKDVLTKDQELFSNKTIQIFDEEFKFHLDRYKYATRYKDVDEIFHRDACLEILKNIENKTTNTKWFFSNNVNKIDISVLPFIRQFRIANPLWFDANVDMPNIQIWLKNFLESKLLNEVMVNFEVWVPNDSIKLFPTNL